MDEIQPVILSGGTGTRLWPLSRMKYPKQFVKLSNGKSLFSETLERAVTAGTNNPIIISNEEYRFYVQESLTEEKQKGDIILEPVGRNTAPAIALAAFATLEKNDALMLVMPSDHRFQYPEDFYASVSKAASAAEGGYLVTFGVNPTSPKTGYGYIKQGGVLQDGVYRVSHFLEKPEKAVAEVMLKSGDHYWNSGIFFFKASAYLKELEKYAPVIYRAVASAWNERVRDLSFIKMGDSFGQCPSDSIDYAVLEHTDKAAVVPMDGGWNDMGSWEAFYEVSKKDSSDNVCVGSVMTENAGNCYLRSSGRLIAAVGVSNLVIVETKDAVLVADRSRSQDVKKIVDQLKLKKRMEFDSHPLVYRPWGCYETLVLSDRFQVKRIVVKPGQQNSLQMHYHRAEHWTVVSGTAEVTIDDSIKLLTENESIYVPLGMRHRIRNPGTIPLVFIEVQTGAYLGEDDIVRFQDNYGRAEAGEEK